MWDVAVNQLDDEELSIGYFQQDGATSHTSHASMAEIQSFSGDCVIVKGLWPPRSPDLTSPDYFFIGISEREILPKQTTNHRHLASKHYEEIQAVTADVLARTLKNIVYK